MIPNPAFAFINNLRGSERSAFQLNTTADGKKYYLIKLKKPSEMIFLNGAEYRVEEQHISVYEFSDKRHDYLMPYHLTVKLKRLSDGQEAILHCYFDEAGSLPQEEKESSTAIVLKQADARVSLTAADFQALKAYANLQAQPVIHDMVDKLNARKRELFDQIESLEKEQEKVSKELDSRLVLYISNLEKMIRLLQEFNQITCNSFRGKLKLAEKILTFCRAKHEKKEVVDWGESDEESKSKPEEKEKTPAPKAVLSEEAQEKEQEDKLKLDAIEKKLIELKLEGEESYLEKINLLEQKSKLLAKKNIDQLILVFQELNKAQDSLRCYYFSRARAGDLAAAQKIIKQNYFIPFVFYYELVMNKHSEVFECLYRKHPILLDAIVVDLHHSKFDSINPSMMGGGVSMLVLAYTTNNLALFKLLLKLGANPNEANLLGYRVIDLIAARGALDYANALLPYKVDLSFSSNVSAKPFYVSSSRNYYMTGFQEEKERKLRGGARITSPKDSARLTPLQTAIESSQGPMVRWLLGQGADINIAGPGDFLPIHVAVYPKKRSSAEPDFKQLDPDVILALVERGASIDSLSPDGASGLFYAVQAGHLDALELLVERFSANPNLDSTAMVNPDGAVPKRIWMNPLTKAITKAPDYGLDAFDFLLNQDVQPLEEKALQQAFEFSSTYLSGPSKGHVIGAIQMNQEKLKLLRRMQSAYEAKDYDFCKIFFRAALNKNKFPQQQYDTALLKLAYQACLRLKEYPEALVALDMYLTLLRKKQAVNLDPKVAKILKTDIESAVMLRDELTRSYYLSTAQAAYDAKDYKTCIVFIEHALEEGFFLGKTKQHADLLLLGHLAYLQLKDYAKANRMFSDYLLLSPPTPPRPKVRDFLRGWDCSFWSLSSPVIRGESPGLSATPKPSS